LVFVLYATQSSFARAHYCLGPVSDLELREDVRDVVPHSLLAEEKSARDRLVALAPSDQLEHFPLALG